MERKIKCQEKISCQICGKMYICLKSLVKHEIKHEDKTINTKVKIKTKVIKCEFCKYESDIKSSIDK